MRNMTKRRRYMLASEKVPRVPEGYQEVEWLRGSGNQWCYLPQGIGLTSDNHFYGIKGDLELLDATGYSKIVLEDRSGQASQPQYSNYWQIRGIYGDLTEGYHPSTMSGLNPIVLSANDELVYHFEINRNSMIINNHSLDNPNFPSGSYINDLRLGARTGTDDSRVVENSNVLIKSIKLTYDGTVTYELIPCYRTADNKAGLFYWINYEQGTSGFITNSGSGSDWLVGPSV